MPDALHLVKIPLRPDRLAAIARRRGLPLRDLDDGYLCHCLLRELWQHRAPAPFVLRGRGRALDVWGYSPIDAVALVAHARAFGDPDVLATIADMESVASKPIPRFEAGQRLGFLLRACPVVRLARGSTMHRPGAEVDAFLARCFAVGAETTVSREDVYREWLVGRLDRPERTGASAGRIRIAGISRERLVRRTQGTKRQARGIERPDVRFEGDLVVVDGDRFNRWLAHGVGRHRAFGFGALILVPPGTGHAA
jgi:CRISPR system Cascade subunit CasE